MDAEAPIVTGAPEIVTKRRWIGGMYMPAKFRIRFLEPVRLERYGPAAAEDVALVQQIADDIRLRIQTTLNEMLRERKSVWFG